MDDYQRGRRDAAAEVLAAVVVLRRPALDGNTPDEWVEVIPARHARRIVAETEGSEETR